MAKTPSTPSKLPSPKKGSQEKADRKSEMGTSELGLTPSGWRTAQRRPQPVGTCPVVVDVPPAGNDPVDVPRHCAPPNGERKRGGDAR
jgi:hypothetical protein